MEHHCHARGCMKPCKPTMLMCSGCWSRVPKALANRVYETYVPGQCDLNPPPTEAWHAAADAAIDYVAKATAAGLTPTMIEMIQHLGRGTGLAYRVGCDQWKCGPALATHITEDARSFGSVTVSRLAKAGMVKRGIGSNSGTARLENAAIAFYVGG